MTDRTTLDKPPAPSAPSRRGALLGAMFLMATSAIGPGFITQTTVFTAKFGAAFAFAILVSVLVDIAIQLNVWRVVGVSGMRAQELGNRVLPGAGYGLAALDVFGGLVFNIGNIAGTALGLNALLGLDVKVGGAVSALVAIGIFLSRRAGVAMDRIVVVLGALMILLTLYVAFVSEPPIGDALTQSVAPETVDFLVITTLIGGTVGGYITYAGAHRMIESGLTGADNVKEINRSAVTGILVTALMRVLLFLAVLGVVAGGVTLAKANPPSSAFEHAAGDAGVRLFGLIMWSAAITSMICKTSPILWAWRPPRRQLACTADSATPPTVPWRRSSGRKWTVARSETASLGRSQMPTSSATTTGAHGSVAASGRPGMRCSPRSRPARSTPSSCITAIASSGSRTTWRSSSASPTPKGSGWPHRPAPAISTALTTGSS